MARRRFGRTSSSQTRCRYCVGDGIRRAMNFRSSAAITLTVDTPGGSRPCGARDRTQRGRGQWCPGAGYAGRMGETDDQDATGQAGRDDGSRLGEILHGAARGGGRGDGDDGHAGAHHRAWACGTDTPSGRRPSARARRAGAVAAGAAQAASWPDRGRALGLRRWRRAAFGALPAAMRRRPWAARPMAWWCGWDLNSGSRRCWA